MTLMKTLRALFLLIVVAIAPASAQTGIWQRAYDDGNAVLRAIDCADSLNCMVAGMASLYGEHHVLKSSDGGATWIVAHVEIADSVQRAVTWFHDIAHPSPQVALVASDSGRIYRTTDGGATWRIDTPVATNRWIKRISMYDARHGAFVVDGTGRLFVTSNGGEGWAEVPISSMVPPEWVVPNRYFVDVHRTSPTNIFLLVTNETKRATSVSTDGGVTWRFSEDAFPSRVGRPQFGYRFPWKIGVSFANSDDGWCFASMVPDSAGLSSYTVMMRTTNGGLKWDVLLDSAFVGNGLHRILFSDTAVGIASGPYDMYRTGDGGRTWTRDSVPPEPPMLLPRRAANLGVGAAPFQWIYHFVPGTSAGADGDIHRRRRSATVAYEDGRLIVDAPPTACASIVAEVYSILGDRLSHMVVTAADAINGYVVDVSDLPSGTYLLSERSCAGTRTHRFAIPIPGRK